MRCGHSIVENLENIPITFFVGILIMDYHLLINILSLANHQIHLSLFLQVLIWIVHVSKILLYCVNWLKGLCCEECSRNPYSTKFFIETYFSKLLCCANKKAKDNGVCGRLHWNISCKIYILRDFTGTSWRLKSPVTPLLVRLFVQAPITENIKAPRSWSLWGDSLRKGPVKRNIFAFNMSSWHAGG